MRTICLAIFSTIGAASSYSLHEWGTFTTVSGSDGVLLSGLEREESPLPHFAYSHFGLENGNPPRGLEEMIKRHRAVPVFAAMKGLGRPVRGVTVKMETPVIYFHSEDAFDVSVKVGFAGGTISQWYPDRSGGETLPEPPPPENPKKPRALEDWTLDFSGGSPWQGTIEWQARVLSPEESRQAILFKPGESLHWMRPRVPEANAVRTASGETEGFLFYRGIGAFDPGLVTTVGSDDTLRLVNRTGGDIPFAMVFEKSGSRVGWRVLGGGVKSGATAAVGMRDFETSDAAFVEPVYREMVAGLTATGLLASEATAMVETWWDSYFAADGLRVFWVLPASKTGAILPLEVTPRPKKVVRVIVGRSEVIRPAKEQEWLALSRAEDDALQTQWRMLVHHDRFGLAYQNRVSNIERSQQPTTKLHSPSPQHREKLLADQ